MRLRVVASTGAWDRWRDEVRAGLRTVHEPIDHLYHAAFFDSMGLDRLDEARASGDESLLYCAAMWFDESEQSLRRIPPAQAAA